MTRSEAESLVAAALEARLSSYSPYSNYAVGAALLAEDGSVIQGTNVENASYGLTICAERVAIGTAAAQGHRSFRALAVATRDGGSLCGACRQVVCEFGKEIVIYLADERGNFRTTTISELLPDSFASDSLDA